MIDIGIRDQLEMFYFEYYVRLKDMKTMKASGMESFVLGLLDTNNRTFRIFDRHNRTFKLMPNINF